MIQGKRATNDACRFTCTIDSAYTFGLILSKEAVNDLQLSSYGRYGTSAARPGFRVSIKITILNVQLPTHSFDSCASIRSCIGDKVAIINSECTHRDANCTTAGFVFAVLKC